MDISFSCKTCGQHILIDESAAGASVSCPSCCSPVTVPTRSDQPQALPLLSKSRKAPSRKNRSLAIAASVLAGIIISSVAGVIVHNKRTLHQSADAPTVTQSALSLQPKPVIKKKDSPAVSAAKAKLELATQKSDLDAMFLALKELQALGDDSAATAGQLTRVQTAIPLLQKVRLFQSDHNHEEVVKAAGQFLDYFPDHPEARRAIKESGLIFAYLQDALNSLSACFEQDRDGKAQLVQKKTDEGKEENDFSRTFFLLSKAEKSVGEAKKLDPQFERALGVERIVSNTKNTLGYSVSLDLIAFDGVIAEGYLSIFNNIYSAMQSTLGSRYTTPSDVWQRVEPTIKEYELKQKKLDDRFDDLASYLANFKGQSSPDAIQIAREIHRKAIQLKDAVSNPTGSMVEYRRDVGAKQSELLDLLRQMKSSAPNVNELRENIIGFGAAVVKYELFKTPSETRPILKKYKDLISA